MRSESGLKNENKWKTDVGKEDAELKRTELKARKRTKSGAFVRLRAQRAETDRAESERYEQKAKRL